MSHIDLSLKQSQITCIHHRLPFTGEGRSQALLNFGQISLLRLSENPSFARGVEAHAVEQGLPTGEAIAALLDRAPVCCRLRHADIFVIYRTLALSLPLWEKHVCGVCGGFEYEAFRIPNAEFTDVSGDGDDLGLKRICIRCVAHGG